MVVEYIDKCENCFHKESCEDKNKHTEVSNEIIKFTEKFQIEGMADNLGMNLTCGMFHNKVSRYEKQKGEQSLW